MMKRWLALVNVISGPAKMSSVGMWEISAANLNLRIVGQILSQGAMSSSKSWIVALSLSPCTKKSKTRAKLPGLPRTSTT